MKSLYLYCVFLCVTVASHGQDKPLKEWIINDDFKIIQLTANTYLHVTYMTFEPYGRFDCNGLIYVDNGQAVSADTPPDEKTTALLIDWLRDQKITIEAVVANHFHKDAMGGLPNFIVQDIPTYGNVMTQEIAKRDTLIGPEIGFQDSLEIVLNDKTVLLYYPGPAHTIDNIVVWIPYEKVLFGGCMIKSVGAGEGNLEDADVDQWSESVQNLKDKFDPQIVIPGHGQYGDMELLNYTIELFEK